MGQDIIYEWIADGQNVLVSVINTPNDNAITSGFADLVNGKVVVETSYAGQPVILTRNQDNTTAIGNLYIFSTNTIEGVSFEIRSTNINDNGSVFWQIVL